MNVVDSSGWLEYFADGANARFFAPPVTRTEELVVPTISIYDVFRRVHKERGEELALQAVALMQQGMVIDLTPALALAAAHVSLEERIPMADSIMLATARAYEAVLWTQDADFKGVSGVRYVARKA